MFEQVKLAMSELFQRVEKSEKISSSPPPPPPSDNPDLKRLLAKVCEDGLPINIIRGLEIVNLKEEVQEATQSTRTLYEAIYNLMKSEKEAIKIEMDTTPLRGLI